MVKLYFTPVQAYSSNFTHFAPVNGVKYPLLYRSIQEKSELVCTMFLTLQQHVCHQQQLQIVTIFLDWLWSRHPKYSLLCISLYQRKPLFFSIHRMHLEKSTRNIHKKDVNIHRLVCRTAVLPLVPSTEEEEMWFAVLTSTTSLTYIY